jgi:hypothetical protein
MFKTCSCHRKGSILESKQKKLNHRVSRGSLLQADFLEQQVEPHGRQISAQKKRGHIRVWKLLASGT